MDMEQKDPSGLFAAKVDRDNGLETSSSKDEGQILQMMGYEQQTLRNYSVLALLGMGFALTNSWWAISSSMVVGLPSGGTVGIVYGLIILFLASISVGITLSELGSAYPNAGGQYYWTTQLGPPRIRRLLAYLTGHLSWFGAIFTSVSVALAVGAGIVGMVQFNNPDLVIDRWMVFLTAELINIVAAAFNIYSKILPTVATVSLYVTLTGFVVSFVTVLASSSHYNQPKFVFAQFINQTGWSNDAIAFIVGLINPSWAFPCLDAATHLAEEVHHPERAIPLAIMGTVCIGFVTSFSYVIAMFFCTTDLDALSTTSTGVPILELFSQAVSSRAGVIVLEVLVTMSGIGTLISSQTWQCRIAWAFSRDNAIPCHRLWSNVNETLLVPINAHILSVLITAILLCLYMASLTAFNSMVSACVIFLYLSYLIPTLCLLIKGRSKLPRGPFYLGTAGLVANCVTILWIVFTTAFFSFPYVMPAETDNMNYLSVVLVAFIVFVMGYWLLSARKNFKIHVME
ncbi:hypothetical protein B0A52_04881 [Exophiala mesophila]|uniref:Choline transport protein n=1 Tax=Exophiala mesophila TaxID=212818 RepID=A0A438N6D6_EXOME|nr:hypothetical protein B0A52_04881 [Exophiala mesophila]